MCAPFRTTNSATITQGNIKTDLQVLLCKVFIFVTNKISTFKISVSCAPFRTTNSATITQGNIKTDLQVLLCKVFIFVTNKISTFKISAS